jgi:photosystem II stability/assembly factor-like uncharacterized protein
VVCGGVPGADNQRKSLYRTTDGGHSWNLISEGTLRWEPTRAAGQMPWFGSLVSPYSSVAFADDQHTWLGTSRGGLYVTETGAQFWEHRQVDASGEEFVPEVQLLGPGRGLVRWNYGATNILFARRDDGLTWTRIYSSP